MGLKVLCSGFGAQVLNPKPQKTLIGAEGVRLVSFMGYRFRNRAKS